jgi:hypothetical protein
MEERGCHARLFKPDRRCDDKVVSNGLCAFHSKEREDDHKRWDGMKNKLASLASSIHITDEEVALLKVSMPSVAAKKSKRTASVKVSDISASVKASEITEDMKERVRAEFKDFPQKLRDTTIFKDVKELPAGRYYIGDPCHFYFDDEELDEKIFELNFDNKNFKQLRTPKGDVLVFHTSADGDYYGNDFIFPVDSASLSVVNANLGNEAKIRKQFNNCDFVDPKPQVFFETFTKPLLVFYQEQKNSLIFISECKGSAWRMEIEDVRFIDEPPSKKKKTQK